MSEILIVRRLTLTAAVLVAAFVAPPAHAYLGPGLGMGLSVVLGIIGSILLAIVSVIWYPIKRLIRRFRRRKAAPLQLDAGNPKID